VNTPIFSYTTEPELLYAFVRLSQISCLLQYTTS